MTHFLKKFVSVMCILTLTAAFYRSVSASAENITVNIAYRQADDNWVISGRAGDKAQSVITIKIFKDGITNVTAEDINGGKALVKLLYTKENGEYSYIFSLGNLFSSGAYTVTAACGEASASASFVYVNADEASEILARVNAAASVEELSDVLSANCSQLGMEQTEYDLKKSCIDEIIFYRRPAAGYDNKSFLGEYNNARCIYDIIHGDETLKEIFDRYTEAIGFSYDKDIAVFGNNVADMLFERLKKQDYKKLSIHEAIEQNLLVSRILCTDRYTYIEGILESEIKANVYNLTYYNKVSDKDKIFKKIFAAKSEISSYKDIKTVFEDASNKAYKEISNASSGGSGSGGGSKGGLSSVRVNPSSGDVFAENGVKFSDVNTHWAKEYIDKLSEMKVISGYPDGTFRPNNNVTRAEFVKLAVSAFNLSADAAGCKFSDVSPDDWCFEFISAAAKSGIVVGTGDLFKPNEAITRQDAAVILARIANAEGMGETNFSDNDKIADYARGAVSYLSDKKIINGDNGSFYPERSITRAETAAMIFRLLNS